MHKINWLFLLWILISSCNQQENKKEVEKGQESSPKAKIILEDNSTISEAQAIEKNGIRLIPINNEKQFENASIEMIQPDQDMISAGKVKFEFDVNGFELGQNTGGSRAEEILNSEEGQHIHFILNNGPYSAEYESNFEKELEEGNNVVLAFLSRSYHESVKTPNAFVFKNIVIGEVPVQLEISSPHLIYSRPKSIYEQKTEKILLDFYLLNGSLSENGMNVKLMVDGIEFILSSWTAYYVEGLANGQHTFRLQLIDKDGNVVAGPFNDSGNRYITLK